MDMGSRPASNPENVIMLHQHTSTPVAVLSPDWALVRDGVSPRLQFRCQQVSNQIQRLLPDADVSVRHRFGNISKVYATLAGQTAAIELQSTGGDVLYRATDALGEPLSAFECPLDRMSFGGPCEEAAAWLRRAS